MSELAGLYACIVHVRKYGQPLATLDNLDVYYKLFPCVLSILHVMHETDFEPPHVRTYTSSISLWKISIISVHNHVGKIVHVDKSNFAIHNHMQGY